MKAKVKNWPENRAVDFRLCQCFNMEGLPSRGWLLLSLRISEEMVARNLDVPVIEVVNSQRTIVFPSGKPATTHLGGVASDHLPPQLANHRPTDSFKFVAFRPGRNRRHRDGVITLQARGGHN